MRVGREQRGGKKKGAVGNLHRRLFELAVMSLPNMDDFI